MKTTKFTGDKKVPMKSLFAGPERKLIDSTVSKFPSWIQGYHLTLMTIPWTIGILAGGYLSQFNLNWLWLSSAMLVMQWFTDSYDGALGRFRDTGIPKWGFYMDHMLDFVFMTCVILAYSFMGSGINSKILVAISFGMGCLMVNSFLAFGATGQFKITYLRTGPTEIRLIFIAINTFIIYFGTSLLAMALPFIGLAFAIGIFVVIYRTQKHIWNEDMNDKFPYAKKLYSYN